MSEKKLFDICIGNPPYQEEQESRDAEGSKKNYAPPVYNLFIDAANTVAEKVELIHPARFLFNAGSTPKKWNEQMLNDKHFAVLKYEADSSKVFANNVIKGGVVISYHDCSMELGPIRVFTPYPELNAIRKKVCERNDFQSLMDIVYSRTTYRLTEQMHKENPFARSRLSEGHDYDMASNIIERIPEIFHDNLPADGIDEYVKIIGRENDHRCIKYIKKSYVKPADNLNYYKVIYPQATGQGKFGEAIAEPFVGEPGLGNTETFISIGKFNTRNEAEALCKYIKTKFLRSLLGVLKVTQIGNRPVWKMIPLQDFTSNSDIDWSKSIPEIDQQLYKKYGLSQEEINFIETHVKEMN